MQYQTVTKANHAIQINYRKGNPEAKMLSDNLIYEVLCHLVRLGPCTKTIFYVNMQRKRNCLMIDILEKVSPNP